MELACGDVPPEQQQKILDEKKGVSKICVKCKDRPSVVIFRRDASCWPCFEFGFSKRFKADLNPARPSKSKVEHLLVAFSGGHASRALLQVIEDSIAERESKDTFIKISVVHIDDSSVYGHSEDERRTKNQKVREVVASYNYPCTILPLEAIFSIKNDEDIKSLTNSASRESGFGTHTAELKKLFDVTKTNSSKEDILSQLLQRMLCYAAESLGFEKVILGTTGSRMATQLIASTCKGRGFSLSEQMATFDKRSDGGRISFIRPMRELLAKDIAIFNRFKNLEPVVVTALDTKSNPKFSIDHLAEAFLEGLQSDFPHTTHTLLRSGGKLTQPPSASNSRRCAMCFGFLSPSEVESVQKASLTSECGSNESTTCCSSDKSCCSTGKKEASSFKLADFVCYGCKRVLSESNEDDLPPIVTAKTLKSMSQSQLRDQIKDFLLEESE
eukprot:TRINITY_DN1871_c0_g3_i1.p2 TRINITY_DN1871_c0_g3~~TRINITY_DN1871_c0_g3_i1.p2  ORF type:complete len:443 (+),score=113.31 TRINITY_DN1871_c0_g3_i1:224-1552(+)